MDTSPPDAGGTVPVTTLLPDAAAGADASRGGEATSVLRPQPTDSSSNPATETTRTRNYFLAGGAGAAAVSWWNTAIHLPSRLAQTVDDHVGLGNA